MSGDYRARNKLLAAVTASGAVLWLTSTGATTNDTGSGSFNDATPLQTRKPLSQRVEEMREKVRAALPQSDKGSATCEIRNIVQFFNFLNCQKNRNDKRCKQ
jgi:hypothetical protein